MRYTKAVPFVLLSCAVSSACGPKRPEPGAGGTAGTGGNDGCTTRFESTYAAIQTRIFEARGCTNDACHGNAAVGGLDLRAGASHSNLSEVRSQSSSLVRVQPGAPTESYFFLKLKAATNPGSVQIANSPMPVGLPPLTEHELEAVRLWIQGGAPETGSVGDPTNQGSSDTIADLLGTCLPPADPIDIAPLEPPAAGEGVQFRSPPWTIGALKEREVCMATYYDFSDQIPAEYKSPDGNKFYTNGSRLRQDPGSHHYVLTNSGLGANSARDLAFGAWTCHAGSSAGAPCDPVVGNSCGEGGVCASAMRDSVACIGFGPAQAGAGGIMTQSLIENVQAANQYLPPREGVYRELPIRGILYHNVHAFNLTRQDHSIQARLNVFFAKNRRRRLVQAIDPSKVFIAAGIPPFTVEEKCADHVAPLGAEMIRLTSHTHKRGKRFTVTLAGGNKIYESLLYSDPLYKEYDPGILFNGATPAERTMRYCAVFNNGVSADGSLNPEAVTRYSRLPDRTQCWPTACVAGKVGARCNGPFDHAACDSSFGSGDGNCDACPITGGPTTEDEMFVIMPYYVMPEGQ